jgi:cell division protein FtsW
MARSTLISYLVIGLTLVGLFAISSASVVSAARDFSDKWYYLKLQSIWAGVGLICFLIFSKLPHQKLDKTASIWLALTLIFLFVVLMPGVGSKFLGARRWINFGITSFQPGEFSKLGLAIYFASLLKRKANAFSPFIIVLAVVCGLVMLQPDLGTTIVILSMSMIVYFGSENELKKFIWTVPIIVGITLILIIFSPYRRERLLTFFNPHQDPKGSSYHIRQVLLSLGSGGVWGVGIGQSLQKYDFVPEVTTDSIFAIIAEEWGFVGASLLIFAFLVLVSQGLEVSKSAKTPFSSLLSLGITAWIGVQVVTNLAAMVALFPLTGIPLPFISYGGTSLVLVMIASGILVNIAKQHE